ncbi:DUF2786 domain-containing protein [Streptomyces geranii]|uniref:DUF2786 domain-containing protein n=1 Tax=Streptomyces geranii TaxID=2058923 RepID=UPI000D02D871|nr:DUF2786 domain-containing protein [Streptomyces geranii]
MTSSTPHPPGTVEEAFKAALYADTDTALDTGASLLAADPTADTELARRGEEFVASAWRRGWQPADVVRLVRRELDEAHVRVVSALILTQAPNDRARGARWTAQLTDLSAAEAPPARGDRFTHATTTLELYRLLLRLPTLEPLDPVDDQRPPKAKAGSKAGSKSDARPESRVLPRIRALLAKAEATGFPEEAEALSAKAQELMARHSIDEALLAAGAPSPDAPRACRLGVDAPYEESKAALLHAVAEANRCRAVWNEALGFSTVVGFDPDLETVELLYTSLLVQATTAMTKAEAVQRAAGRKRTKTFRQSFMAAYAHNMGERLTATAAAQTPTPGDSESLLPILATRDVAVTAHLTHLFPTTTTTRLRAITDEAGWEEGTAAATRARVHRGPRLPGV